MAENGSNQTNRRAFLQTSMAGIIGASVASHWTTTAEAAPASDKPMPMRSLGSTGEQVSLLALGGYHMGVSRMTDKESVRMVHEAMDNGVNFMDNAWEYHQGRSEVRLGKALKDRRDKAFVMTKHHGREKKMAMEHLEDSLKRLQTDHIDLWMFHECVYDEDPDRIFAPGGGIEAAEEAKRQGKVRYIGFTGHKWPRIHLKLLAYGYPWDAVLMPQNILDGSFRSFEQWVLPVLVKRGIAPLAMKTRAGGDILKNGIATSEDCWRYVASLPVSTIVSGMDSIELMRQNLRLAKDLEPMSQSEKEAILKRTQEMAATGKYERFKTTRSFDGPVGREMYGIGA